MLSKIFESIFGTRDSRTINKIKVYVNKINDLEDQFSSLSDEELKLKTKEFKERVSQGESLESILPEAFATVRETSKRVLGMRHFDVQLIGGVVLHQGKIAEMRTGEGKTLVATLPVYLNALTGGGVHVITVNDYLAKRDKEWMGKIYEFLGLSVGVIVAGMSPEERKKEYSSDIVYGTNNEFGFDYLRDNMTQSLDDVVQKNLNFVIVDEVDSILIDEARTPLIISGSSKDMMKIYELFASVAKQLGKDSDYEEFNLGAAMGPIAIDFADGNYDGSSVTDTGYTYTSIALDLAMIGLPMTLTAGYWGGDSSLKGNVYTLDYGTSVSGVDVGLQVGRNDDDITAGTGGSSTADTTFAVFSLGYSF